MKEKKLYSSAIIPDELYVQRDADRKLKEVILRMSKPAYISVARQMGKTNLLIQTKRSLQNESNRYVYIDITNKFETAHDCFRYIVNQILNSNDDIDEFQEAKKQIETIRQTSTNNATEEYQNEIREILKRYKGNIVVFLDEVDDLRKHSFSDDIFGQIRKTYFINETYPVLKRITYILSGVIDPEKLIKTKENSPFNIAIPIYLEDFNQSEFNELVNKSDLVLDDEIKEYIYNWLQGNPRMSFEILSIIEDEFIAGNEITKVLVDKAINDFYLKNFKNPPIDHIRDLIKHNTEVRKALIKLKNGQIDELTDEVINKFYLFGITASKTKKENLKIKNKVIELSLSNDWLEKIELEKKGYFDYAKEKQKNKEYLEALKYFKEYIENDPQGSLVSFAKFNIGEIFHVLKNYEASNQYLLEKPINIEYIEIYYDQQFYIGVNYLRLDDLTNSISVFEDIIKNYKNNYFIAASKLNLCEIYLIQNEKNSEFVLDKYNEVLDFVNQNEIKDKENFYKLIYYRIASILQQKLETRNSAIEFFEKSLFYAKDIEKPNIYIYLDSCYVENIEKRIEIYKTVSNLIQDKQLKLNDENEIIIPLSETHLFFILSNLFEFNLMDNFNSLLDYSLNSIFDKKLKEYELVYKTSIFAINNNNVKVGKELLLKVLNFKEVNPKTLKYCYQVLGILEYNENNISLSVNFLSTYIQLFRENNNFKESLQSIDFDSFITLIEYYREKKEYEKSYQIAKLIEIYIDENLNYENKANSIVILFFIMDYFAFIGDKNNATIYGKRILSLINIVKPVLNELSYVDKKGIENIEKQTKSLLNNFVQVKSIEPIKAKREPGRNEFVKVKYKNSKVVVAKYKKVMEDIKKGECIIINY